jgi:hypothetical protein
VEYHLCLHSLPHLLAVCWDSWWFWKSRGENVSTLISVSLTSAVTARSRTSAPFPQTPTERWVRNVCCFKPLRFHRCPVHKDGVSVLQLLLALPYLYSCPFFNSGFVTILLGNPASLQIFFQFISFILLIQNWFFLLATKTLAWSISCKG